MSIKADEASVLLDPCRACGRQWGNPLIRFEANGPVFRIRCGQCGNESAAVSLTPAIESWNGSNVEQQSNHEKQLSVETNRSVSPEAGRPEVIGRAPGSPQRGQT